MRVKPASCPVCADFSERLWSRPLLSPFESPTPLPHGLALRPPGGLPAACRCSRCHLPPEPSPGLTGTCSSPQTGSSVWETGHGLPAGRCPLPGVSLSPLPLSPPSLPLPLYLSPPPSLSPHLRVAPQAPRLLFCCSLLCTLLPANSKNKTNKKNHCQFFNPDTQKSPPWLIVNSLPRPPQSTWTVPAQQLTLRPQPGFSDEQGRRGRGRDRASGILTSARNRHGTGSAQWLWSLSPARVHTPPWG